MRDFKKLLLEGYYEYRIALGGSAGTMFSRKDIKYNPKTKIFKILNHIDDTKQSLTQKQLMSQSWTNIGIALRKHCLIVNLKLK